MKRIVICVFIFVLAITCCSCERMKDGNLSSRAEKNHQELMDTEIAYEKNWLKNGLSKVGLENVTVSKKTEGFSNATKQKRFSAFILCDYNHDTNEKLYHDSYLAIETDDKVLFEDLSNHYPGSYSDTLHVCDLDGDLVDEIIVQQTVGMSGGAGQYQSRIYKLMENSRIQEIFISSPQALYDTGFTGITNGNLLKIKNKFTGYEMNLEYNTNKNNQSITPSILCDSFSSFEPQDIDHDGVFEIRCTQYVSLYGHADYIGDAHSVLKYNQKNKQFEVIEASFSR